MGHSFSLSHRLREDLSEHIEAGDGIPASMILPDANWKAKIAFDDMISCHEGYANISPDGKRVLISCKCHNPTSGEWEIHIIVFRFHGALFEKETWFRFNDLNVYLKRKDGTTVYNFRRVCFMGNDHIAVAMANGFLRILSVKDNDIFLEKKIGGLIATLAVSDHFIAASLFPGISEAHKFACGVKIYSINTIVQEKRLESSVFIPGETFSILPHSMRFDHEGTRLLCKGSKIMNKGYVNYMELYDLNLEKLTNLCEETAADISHRISNFSDNHEYCRFSGEGLLVYDQYHRKIWEPEVPEDLAKQGIQNCKLSDDGSRIICCRAGLLYHLQKKAPAVTCFATIGCVGWAYFLSGSQIIAGTDGNYDYDIKLIDTKDFSVRSALNHPGNIEWINRDGYDISKDGNLLIGDPAGSVRKLAGNLMDTSVTALDCGPLRQVLADPFKHEDALLSENGAIVMMDTESGRTRLRISNQSQKPVKPGSGYQHIQFSQDTDDRKYNLWMAPGKTNKDLRFHLTRILNMEKFSSDLGYSDHFTNPPMTRLHTVPLASSVCDSLQIAAYALILLQDGSIIRVDPFAVPDPQRNPEMGRATTVIENIPSPRGFARLSDNRIAVWTKDSLICYELSQNFEVIHAQTKPVSGILNVKWDDFNQRLVVAFSRYLGFWSLDLDEMYRLYFLSRGGHLIHVPVPEALRTPHHNHHPGYFWSSCACTDLFEVRSRDRKTIIDRSMRESFISQYFNRFMVELAVECYDTFCRCMAGEHLCCSETVPPFLLA